MLKQFLKSRSLGLEEELLDRIHEAMDASPPTIGVVGVSGVGKSSTINSMFKTTLPTSPTVRCTQEFSDHLVSAEIRQGPAAGNQARLRVVDAPGLGEDVDADGKYLEMYRRHLPRCDVILWVMMARNRAVALDQYYLSKLEPFHRKIVFGINQVDLVEPVDWDTGRNLPSRTQRRNIEEITKDRRRRLEKTVGREIEIVAYGAKQHYRLIGLFEMLIEACPPERRWLFELVRGTSARDWLDRAEGLSEEEKQMIIKRSATAS